MKIYFCYKFRNYTNKTTLRKKLETISELLERQGHSTYIYWRDNQKWSIVPSKEEPQSIVTKAFRQIRDSDILFAFTDTQDVSEGMLLELGYGYAIGKKIIFVTAENSLSRFVIAIANKVIEFNAFGSLINSLAKMDLAKII